MVNFLWTAPFIRAIGITEYGEFTSVHPEKTKVMDITEKFLFEDDEKVKDPKPIIVNTVLCKLPLSMRS